MNRTAFAGFGIFLSLLTLALFLGPSGSAVGNGYPGCAGYYGPATCYGVPGVSSPAPCYGNAGGYGAPPCYGVPQCYGVPPCYGVPACAGAAAPRTSRHRHHSGLGTYYCSGSAPRVPCSGLMPPGCGGYPLTYGCAGVYGCQGIPGCAGTYGYTEIPGCAGVVETPTAPGDGTIITEPPVVPDDGNPVPRIQAPATQPPSLPMTSQPPSATGSSTAMLRLRVPSDAVVTVNGRPTFSDGAERIYAVRNLDASVSQRFEVRVEIRRNGQTISESQSVDMLANQDVALDFPVDGASTNLAPVANW